MKFKVLVVSLALTLGITSPASAAPIYTFPVTGCAVTYSKYHHDYPAADIFGKKGCAFVSPVAGIVDEVNSVDKWSGKTNLGSDRGGLSISIIGDDGLRYYGSHLSKIEANIIPGYKVATGEKLGEIGSTGSARGTKPHLHFGISYPTEKGIWWVRRGVGLEKGKTSPWKYLQAWQVGKDLKPKLIVPSLIPAEPKK
ncbi:metalloendopeptidase [Candidatus Nanopelagicus limnes]|uniref:Metalloendopeptidase n=1 Tax=Candidatus Nanopelagicus limnae TaxID=1884634 RepID=A0A249JX91_9ACTN|nr:M23 family metallopeptidase [Candidatus Nanopelagicus limnes]ASY09126.1 metalloendopeptidase [Candidatus Nanopelagicus limnes]